jgi:pentatricopeptide repeat protein
MRIFSQFRADGLNLDGVLIAVMIHVFGKVRHYEQLSEILEQMTNCGIKPDTHMLKMITEIYDEAGMHEKAAEFLTRMQEKLGEMPLETRNTLQRLRPWSLPLNPSPSHSSSYSVDVT